MYSCCKYHLFSDVSHNITQNNTLSMTTPCLTCRLVSKEMVRLTQKPIFHWKLGMHWLPNANEINTKKLTKNVHGQRQPLALGTQCHLYSTCSCWGLALGGNANFSVCVRTNADFSVYRYQHVDIPNPTPGSKANGFASQWSIG